MSSRLVAAIFAALLLTFVGVMLWSGSSRRAMPPLPAPTPPPLAGEPDLGIDVDRVWHSDLEADVGPGNNVYAATVRELAALTRGTLQVRDVVERWGGPKGPITVEFVEGGARHRFSPKYEEDWLVLEDVLAALNGVLDGRGLRLEAIETDDQTARVVALTPDEKARLARRGVRFSE